MTWLRRARPCLGTLVEVGGPEGQAPALEAAFCAVAKVQRLMSAQDPASEVGRFNAAPAGTLMAVHPWTLQVLTLAWELNEASGGAFDVAQGTGPWALHQGLLHKLSPATRLHLGGIAKGEAVDRALEALLAAGASAGWVNAGGDLRVQGLELPVGLRDERRGGLRPWATLQDGALATSYFPPEQPGRLSGAAGATHVTVAAPRCVLADALTKVVARTGLTSHPLFATYEAQAWIHA